MGRTIELYGFPSVESPESVKKFLEEHAGEGSVSAVEVGQRRPGSRAFAKVEFTDPDKAEAIIALSKGRLWYGDSYLKARDLSAKAKDFSGSIEDVKLNFGCRVSKEKFSVLWRRENVRVKFGEGMRKLYFFFSYESGNFKLDLSFESIWKIELRCPPGQDSKFLLLQLLGAPRIFRRQDPDKYWARDVDFTPSRSIGQSSALCLEIPKDFQLPNLRDGFVCYKQEEESRFSLVNGSSFSSNSDLVPLLLPPQGIDLPYKILFKVNSLVQHGCLPGEALDLKFFRLVDPARIKPEYIESALEKLYHLKDCCYDPLRWLTTQYTSYGKSGKVPETPSIALDQGLVYVHRVQITPSKVYFCGPEIILSNRVLRNYPDDIDNFLRVSFVDEDLERLRSTDLSLHPAALKGKGRTRVYKRILSVLQNGVVIGDKKFEFLGFSSSQLRESSCWMFASRDGLTAADIRTWMGDFRDIRNVAKYSARLGQSFGSSRETLRVDKHEVDLIPDIELLKDGGKYCFSDGIGKISEDFSRQVAAKCGLNRFAPSAFQIRYGGYKGVVAVDPRSSTKLSLRKSMCKYRSERTKLDVLAWSKYMPSFLNRQLITLLSTLGVRDHVFRRKQKEAVTRLDAILTDPSRARDELELMFPGEITNVLKEMLSCGYKPDEEPFLAMMLRTLHASKFQEIRNRTRIYVPEGRALMGCLDETGTLEYGQVFVQCSRREPAGSVHEKFIVNGEVVVAKNPCLHPGDMRVLEAVDAPELRHMVDCVVFPQKGKRPHPNECSGSDLDGDVYFVCWDPELIPPQQVEAMNYTAAETIQLNHDVQIEEVTKYFVDYILDDNLGLISNAHTVFADRQRRMARSKPCLELAELFSIAVDFPKTGVPAKIPRHLRPREYPDFMEKLDKPTYESQHVLGKLFRAVKNVQDRSGSIKSFTREAAGESYDLDMEVEGFEGYVEEALGHKARYDRKLGNLMDYYGIQTEAELLGGNVLKSSRRFDKKRDLDSANYAVKSLIKEARAWFDESENNGNNDDIDDECSKKASAWYHVTYHPRYWGRCNDAETGRDHFLSFAWCVFDKLAAIKRDKIEQK